MNERKLIVSIVPEGIGQAVSEMANRAGAAGGTLFFARGTAPSTWLSILGVGRTGKEVLLTVVEDSCAAAVFSAIREGAQMSHHRAPGLLFLLDVLDFRRSGEDGSNLLKEKTMQQNESCSQVITVILNKNYADEAMAAARKAGATGGTVFQARGTARPEDEKFFGVPLVPEKEVLLILVSDEQAEGVYRAICGLACFAEKGSGIIFRVPVCESALLGEKRP